MTLEVTPPLSRCRRRAGSFGRFRLALRLGFPSGSRRVRRGRQLTVSSWHRPHAIHVAAGVGVLGSLTIGVAVASVGPSLRWMLVGGIVLGLGVTLIVRRKQTRRLDIVDPLVLFSIAWIAMFAVRPIASALANDWTLRRSYDVNEWIDTALALALMAEAAYCLALLVASRGIAHTRLRAPRAFARSPSGYVVGLAAAGIGLLVTTLTFGSQIVTSSSYVQSLPTLSIPGSLLLIGLSWDRPAVPRSLGYAVVAIVLASFAVIGVRTWILPLLGSVTFLWYFRHHARPRISTILIGGTLLLIVFSNLEVTRSAFAAGAEISDISPQTLEPIAAIDRLATGPSSEMLPALALEVGTQGTDWSYSPGYWATSLLAHWVPSDVWPAKPKSSGELLYSIFFPGDYAVSRANTQFSVIGEFYYDSGIIGVVAGLAGLGVGTGLIYAWFRRNEANVWAQISYSMFPWLLVFGLRGDLLQTSALAFFLYTPVALAYVLSPKSADDSHESGSGTLAVARPASGLPTAAGR